MLKSIGFVGVAYSAVAPFPLGLGFLWQDTATNPATLMECVSLSPVTYQAVASSSGGGTVTSVAAGDGLIASPSPITGSGTISLQNRFADSMLLMGA